MVCFFLAILTVLTVIPYEQKRREGQLGNIEALLQAVYQQKREALANEMFAGQELAMQRSILDIQAVQQIVRVELYQLDGQFLLASDERPSRPLPEKLRNSLSESFSFTLQEKDRNSYAVFDSLVEIIGEKVGYIRIYYDLEDLQKEFYGMTFLILGIVAILILGGGIVANLILSHAVIKPTAKLSDAIRKVREGKLGEQVSIDSTDEIGSMAADFNDMSHRLFQKNEDLMGAIQAKDASAIKLAKTNKQLETLNTELEKRVEERTAELRKMNEQLHQEIHDRQRADKEKRLLQEKLARSKKMEALGLLAGGVAHDLNNVLSGLVSYPDLLLLQLEESSPLRKPISIIQKSGQKASAIVQDLLTLARRSVVTKEIININQVIKAYLDSPEYQQVMKYHPGIDVKVHLQKDLLPILGSSIHIAKTVMNLVANAAEAQPDGGEISIETKNHYQDISEHKYELARQGEYVLLRISDCGSGIADEDLERIFEPFYTKKVLGRSGTGLGMAVVWGAVQDHNGYIDVRSKPDQGSTFELYFPVNRKAIEQIIPEHDSAALEGNGETILIVDDVEEQREITTAMLTHLNYRTSSVESGEAALAFLRQNEVDLIILDMIMDPGIDGLDTYRRIKEISPSQKAIIASGFSENERVEEAIMLGVGVYIRKPFTLETLGKAVQRELSTE
jgi:signal transduction histidine kinase/ActR/RegA family two-component response regulator